MRCFRHVRLSGGEAPMRGNLQKQRLRRAAFILFVTGLAVFVASREMRSAKAQSSVPQAEASGDSSALLAAYRHVEVASVSDAIEQLLQKRMYLSHRMQPLF